MSHPFGAPRLHLRSVDSTNERAGALAAAGAPGGTVVTANEQSAGRGRLGRRWSAPPGAALLCSAILRPLGSQHALLPLAVPLAVCEAIEAIAPVRCAVKWPNDVWIAERKVAGVLIEARPPQWAVIGVGVNLSVADGELPVDLRWPAASVGHDATPEVALQAVSAALERWCEAEARKILAAFASRDALRGRAVGWAATGSADGEGVAAGIDERGNLLVERPDGSRASLGAGEVSLRVGG